MEVFSCTVCYSQDFRYDEEHCRNVCNTCNAMQDITGVGITSYLDDPNVNLQRLATVKLKKNPKLTGEEKKQMKNKDSSPWDLHQLFKWIFDKQVLSLKPYVNDWEHFIATAEAVWNKYSTATGNKFDITKESLDNIRLQKYPVGWGAEYDPKIGTNEVSKASREFNKYKRDQIGSGSNSDVDYDKLDLNAKKIRVERLVTMKKKEKEIKDKRKKDDREKEKTEKEKKECELKHSVKDDDNNKYEKEEEFEDDEMKEIHEEEVFNEMIYSSDEDEESALEDEEDSDYLQIDHIDEKALQTVRALRKKKSHEVMYTGCYVTHASRYMETNIAILFLSLYFHNDKKDECYCLMDILRLVKQKVIPYIRLTRFLPTDKFCINDHSYARYVLRDHAPSWDMISASFTKIFRDMNMGYLIEVNLETLTRRILKDLNLPQDLYYVVNYIRVKTYAVNQRNIGSMKDSILIKTKYQRMGRKYPYTLLPEPFCIAHIFMAIKYILRLNVYFEVEVSYLVKKLEQLGVIEPGSLFVWTDWWKDYYKGPTISNCKNWEDIEKVGNPFDFFEIDTDEIEDNYEGYAAVGLEPNETFNQHGRRVVLNNKSTHKETIDNLQNSFIDLVKTFDNILKKKPIKNDYRESDAKFLIDPKKYLECYLRPENLLSQDQENPNLVIEKLSNLIQKNKRYYERIGYENVDLNANIFHKNFTDNTTDMEETLLVILTYNTGFNKKSILPHVRFLEKNIFEKKKIEKKKVNRKRKRGD